MRTELYISNRFGELTVNPTGAWMHPYFLPNPIPPELVLGAESVSAVSRADLALGRLSGLAMLIDDLASVGPGDGAGGAGELENRGNPSIAR